MLGIIGGVGPRATARLYLGLTSRCAAQAGGTLPALLVHSVPMTRAIEDAYLAGHAGGRSSARAAARAMLADAVAGLVRGGAELLMMPCNTLQGDLRSLCAEQRVEHLDMLDATAEAIANAGARRVLILGTTTTFRTDAYGPRLRRHGIDGFYPSEREQALVEAQIRDALDLRPSPRNRLLELVNAHARECDAVLLACTDLSRDMLAELDAVAVFDSLECLAVAAARRVASAAVQPGAREWEVHDGG